MSQKYFLFLCVLISSLFSFAHARNYCNQYQCQGYYCDDNESCNYDSYYGCTCSSSISGGAIAGIVIGSFVGCCLIAACIAMCVRRRTTYGGMTYGAGAPAGAMYASPVPVAGQYTTQGGPGYGGQPQYGTGAPMAAIPVQYAPNGQAPPPAYSSGYGAPPPSQPYGQPVKPNPYEYENRAI